MTIGRENFMKKVLISLALLIPFLTGCANIDTNVTINDDKSGYVVTSLTYKGDLSDRDNILSAKIAEGYESFLDSKYKVEKAFGANLSTITASKSVKNLENDDLDLSSLGFVSQLPDKKFIQIKKSFLLTSFNVDCVYDNSSRAEDFKNLEPVAAQKSEDVKQSGSEYYHKYGDASELESAFDSDEEFAKNLDEDTKQAIADSVTEGKNEQQAAKSENAEFSNTFSIKVPSIASYNNADSISGNVYTWNLKDDGTTEIKLQYVQYSGFAIAFMLLLGVLLLVVLAGRILKRDSQKRIDNVDNIV